MKSPKTIRKNIWVTSIPKELVKITTVKFNIQNNRYSS